MKSPHKNKRNFPLLFLHNQGPGRIFSIILIAIYKESDPKENPNNTKERRLWSEHLECWNQHCGSFHTVLSPYLSWYWMGGHCELRFLNMHMQSTSDLFIVIDFFF